MELTIDNSPQAKFVKNLLKKDHPELNEQEIEKLWQDRLKAVENDSDGCVACGS